MCKLASFLKVTNHIVVRIIIANNSIEYSMYFVFKKQFSIYMRLKPFSNKRMRGRRIRLTDAKIRIV